MAQYRLTLYRPHPGSKLNTKHPYRNIQIEAGSFDAALAQACEMTPDDFHEDSLAILWGEGGMHEIVFLPHQPKTTGP